MIITFTFISILLIFIRIYSVFNLSFVHEDKSYFPYRITVFTLFFETFVIFFYSFFNGTIFYVTFLYSLRFTEIIYTLLYLFLLHFYYIFLNKDKIKTAVNI